VVIGLGLLLLTRVSATGNYLTEVLPALLVFGFGLAINVAPLTSTVLAAAPPERAGTASAVNNDVARAAGLIAVAVLPAAAGLGGASYLHPAQFSAGFHTAALISAALCVVAGVLAAVTIRNPARVPEAVEAQPRALHCGLDAPPQRPAPQPETGAQQPAG
jgi:MFS family permease